MHRTARMQHNIANRLQTVYANTAGVSVTEQISLALIDVRALLFEVLAAASNY